MTSTEHERSLMAGSEETFPPTREQVLMLARDIQIGYGLPSIPAFFQLNDGHSVVPEDVEKGIVAVSRIAGVCPAGSVVLAQFMLGDVGFDSWSLFDEVVVINGRLSKFELHANFHKLGVAHACAILDVMLANEQERTYGDELAPVENTEEVMA